MVTHSDPADCFNQVTHLYRRGDNVAACRLALHYGSHLLEVNQPGEAIPFFFGALQASRDLAAARGFATALSQIRLHAPQPIFKPWVTQALLDQWAPPAALSRVVGDLLIHEPSFLKAFSLCNATMVPHDLITQPSVLAFADDPLLLALLRTSLVTTPKLEAVLTSIRQALLVSECRQPRWLPFVTALAIQCFANEYAWMEQPNETEAVEALKADRTSPMAAALLACYRPLHTQLSPQEFEDTPWPDSLSAVLDQQWYAPQEERLLASSIPSLTAIDHETSVEVRAQYESHPYPRWTDIPPMAHHYTLTQWIQHRFPQATLPTTNPAPLTILIAGCGTGQQSAIAGLRFADAHITALDLSRSSLAYAMRKTTAMNLRHITYAQADLLELDAAIGVFDVVECIGVLHHLRDPMQGWKKLVERTAPGGYLCIALYSELARRKLDAVRAFAGEQKHDSDASLRAFRSAILALPPEHPAAFLREQHDFYALSMLRDLVFHVQEHRFTIPRIQTALGELGLEFGGFDLTAAQRHQFATMHKEKTNLLDLDQWAAFETAYPDSFASMYHFLLRKPLA